MPIETAAPPGGVASGSVTAGGSGSTVLAEGAVRGSALGVTGDTASRAGDDADAGVRTLSYAEAIRDALAQAMEADPHVFLFGEDVGVYGGAFGVSTGLVQRFGPERVIDTPISELALAGAAVGAALTGMRPVLEIQFSDFVTLAMEQLVNQAAKIHFMFGGKACVPMVVRLPGGSGTGAAAQHSQSLEAWFAHVPGLKVVQPSTPHDAKGLLLAALDDPNPVLVFEHKLLYKTKGPVPVAPYRVPLGSAAVRRAGRDVTIVASSIMTLRALAAAERLAADGIDAEVIDLRSLRPLDFATIAASLRKTRRLAIVHEGVKTMGIGAEIAALVAESDVFHALAAPVARLGGADVPIPYNPVLEKAAVPQEHDIVAAAARLVLGAAR
jgi:acetoin:2,6-dichlorophenolindophenol oxidoreductase subunit beta